MDFGEAIHALKDGKCLQRAGWNGKNMHIYLEDSTFKGEKRTYEPVIIMFTAQGAHQPGWLATQADMLALDWQTIDPD